MRIKQVEPRCDCIGAFFAYGNSESDKYRFNTAFLTGSDYYRYPIYRGKAALLCTKHIKPKRHTAVAVFDAVGGLV